MKDVETCWTSDLPCFMVFSFGEFCLPPQNFSITKVCYAPRMNKPKSKQLRKLINSQYFLVSVRKLVRLRITFKIKFYHILIMCVLEINIHVENHCKSHEQSHFLQVNSGQFSPACRRLTKSAKNPNIYIYINSYWNTKSNKQALFNMTKNV